MNGNDLRKWRESMDMSQLEFGQNYLPTKVTPGTVSNWETDKSVIPGWVKYIWENENGYNG